MTKLFADLELKKKKMEDQESKERKRQRDEEDATELKTKKEKEWKSDWEVSDGTPYWGDFEGWLIHTRHITDERRGREWWGGGGADNAMSFVVYKLCCCFCIAGHQDWQGGQLEDIPGQREEEEEEGQNDSTKAT